jgi:Tfp pilus assembly protein PilW
MKKFQNKKLVEIESMRVKDQRGFTLSELMIAAGLSLAVMASIYGLFRSQTHTIKGQESRMEAHEYAMSVLDIMVREIRNTGYFPTGTACANVSNTGGIVSTTTAQSFRFVYDTNGDGVCEEDISFAYDGTNVLRNSQSLTDGNVTALQFTYYPQQTSGTAPAPFCVSTGIPAGCSGNLSSNLGAVQKITISVTVQSKNPDVQFGGQSTVTMSSSADLRNHGLSS